MWKGGKTPLPLRGISPKGDHLLDPVNIIM